MFRLNYIKNITSGKTKSSSSYYLFILRIQISFSDLVLNKIFCFTYR
jgi:hypothetical protein